MTDSNFVSFQENASNAWANAYKQNITERKELMAVCLINRSTGSSQPLWRAIWFTLLRCLRRILRVQGILSWHARLRTQKRSFLLPSAAQMCTVTNRFEIRSRTEYFTKRCLLKHTNFNINAFSCSHAPHTGWQKALRPQIYTNLFFRYAKYLLTTKRQVRAYFDSAHWARWFLISLTQASINFKEYGTPVRLLLLSGLRQLARSPYCWTNSSLEILFKDNRSTLTFGTINLWQNSCYCVPILIHTSLEFRLKKVFPSCREITVCPSTCVADAFVRFRDVWRAMF